MGVRSGGVPYLLPWVVGHGHRDSVFIASARQPLRERLRGTNPSPGLGGFLGQLEGQPEDGLAGDAVRGLRGAMAGSAPNLDITRSNQTHIG